MVEFSPDLISMLRSTLEDASKRVRPDSAMKALMAECILRAAAQGIRSRDQLRAVAIEVAQREVA